MVIDWLYNYNNQRIIRCFFMSASHCIIIFCLEVRIMEYSNYPLGIGVAIASIAIVIALAISNPMYFAIASLAVMKYIK